MKTKQLIKGAKMVNHIWVEHKNCDQIACPICEGGLSVCSVCGLTEGSLTTDCPGYTCWEEKNEEIYTGQIDFRNGKWVNKPSPHSPNYGCSLTCSDIL